MTREKQRQKPQERIVQKAKGRARCQRSFPRPLAVVQSSERSSPTRASRSERPQWKGSAVQYSPDAFLRLIFREKPAVTRVSRTLSSSNVHLSQCALLLCHRRFQPTATPIQDRGTDAKKSQHHA